MNVTARDSRLIYTLTATEKTLLRRAGELLLLLDRCGLDGAKVASDGVLSTLEAVAASQSEPSDVT